MFIYDGKQHHYNRFTGKVTAKDANGAPVTLDPHEYKAARMAFSRYPEALGYASAAQDATPHGDRDTDVVVAFARAFAVNMYTREIGLGAATTNVADAWATWQAFGRLDVSTDQERHRRPVQTAAGTVNHAFEPLVDHCYRSMMDANMTEPYVHAEYDRWDEMLKAALVLLTNGDMPYARALRWAFTNSGEDIAWHLALDHGDRNSMCYEAGEMPQEDYEATLRWAVECEEDGETWVDAFATREQAVQHADSLVANTKVVDRQATTDAS